MVQLHPHINFNGNAEEAFTFYQSVFGGAFSRLVRFKDMAGPGFAVAEHEAHKVMHIELPVGTSSLMGNDVPESMGRTNEHEHRSKIVIRTDSKAEADHLFQGLSEGGQVEVPMTDSPWGSYFGMFRDKYGIEWILEFAPKQPG